MAEQNAREVAIREAIELAENTCRAAFDSTEQRYWGYLQLLPRNKRVGGPDANPWYAAIKMPYISVDGRVKMAQDHHSEKGERLTMQTGFVEIAGIPHFYAYVTSGIFGSTTAHARIFVNGSGVDKTNPVENAETSAIGRALGFFGYGLVGSGVASAEEVLGAMAEREDKKVPNVERAKDGAWVPRDEEVGQEGDRSAPGNSADQTRQNQLDTPDNRRGARQMSDKQATFLYSLLANLGVEAADAPELTKLTFPEGLTVGMASSEINELREVKSLPRHWVNAYVKMLQAKGDITIDKVAAYTEERYGETLPSALKGEEQKELFAWMRDDVTY